MIIIIDNENNSNSNNNHNHNNDSNSKNNHLPYCKELGLILNFFFKMPGSLKGCSRECTTTCGPTAS